MYIVAGSAMVALGLVGVSLLAWLFRASGTPRWLGSDLAAMLLCIPVTALMGLGCGYVLIGLSHGLGLVEVAALVGCAAVLWGVRWVIRRHMPAPLVSAEPPTPQVP